MIIVPPLAHPLSPSTLALPTPTLLHSSLEVLLLSLLSSSHKDLTFLEVSSGLFSGFDHFVKMSHQTAKLYKHCFLHRDNWSHVNMMAVNSDGACRTQ